MIGLRRLVMFYISTRHWLPEVQIIQVTWGSVQFCEIFKKSVSKHESTPLRLSRFPPWPHPAGKKNSLMGGASGEGTVVVHVMCVDSGRCTRRGRMWA